MVNSAEAPIQNEVRPPDSIETKVYGEGKKTVNLTCAKFTNGGGTEEVGATEEKVKPKSMVVFPMGWPWDASAKTTHDFPGQLAKGLNTTSLAISTRSQRDNPEGRMLQGDAMYQCLLENGLDQETQLIIIGHSEGAIKGAYLAKTLEDNGFKPDLFILVSPMGLNSRSTAGLLKDFIVDTFITGKKERQKGGVRAGDKDPVVEKVPEKVIQEEFKDSLKKKWQAGGVRGLWSQIKGLVTKDPIFSQIKVPIIDLANDKDKVSNHRSYLPEAEVRRRMAPLTRDDILRKMSDGKWEKLRLDLTGAEDWESLGDQEKQKRLEDFDKKFGTKEQFVNRYSNLFARQEEMVRLKKAREQLAKEIHFQSAKKASVVIPTRQADHNGIPVARGEQTPSLIKRFISLAERAAKKAA